MALISFRLATAYVKGDELTAFRSFKGLLSAQTLKAIEVCVFVPRVVLRYIYLCFFLLPL